MKHSPVYLFVCTALLCSAQKIEIRESTEKFYATERNAVKTTIYENVLKDVVEGWKDYLLKNKCERVADDKVEIYGHNIFLKEIINKPIDIYCRFVEDKETKQIQMRVALDIGAGNYIKSENNPNEFKLFEKAIREFAVKMTKAPIEAYMAAAINYQKKLHREIKVIENNKLKVEENIADTKIKIEKTEKKLAEKKAERELKINEMAAQKKINDTITDAASDRAKLAKKALEKLTDKQKDIEGTILDVEKDIKEYQLKIQNFEKDIKSGQDTKVFNLKEIETQKTIEENWKKRLDQIS